MKEELHRLHDELDDHHWWFTARRQIVLQVLTDALADPGTGRSGALRFLDIGCGGGGTLRALARLGEAHGMDAAASAVAAARRRGDCDVRLGHLPDGVPWADGSFDVVTLLYVLEHIDDDAGSLDVVRRLLAPGGLMLCTVAAYHFLWSAHDVANEHRRRYTRPELGHRLEVAGLQVRKLTHYNTFPFPFILAVGCGANGQRGAPQRAERERGDRARSR